MAKLYAMEDMDLDNTAADLEVSPEEGEVADATIDIDTDATDIAEDAEGIEGGVDADERLEEVENLVEKSNEGEGMNEETADAVRIAVEAICSNIGANPRVLYSLYASENFSSPSSRKANGVYAFEGIGEFVADMWKRMKASLAALWAKVVAFWNKNVSTLGRIKKALDAMKTRVGNSSGKLKNTAYIDEAPSGLYDAVGFEGEVNTKNITAIIATHEKLITASDSVIELTNQFNAKAGANITTSKIRSYIESISGGPDTNIGPLVGGINYKITLEKDAEEGTVNFTIERENVERKDRGGMSLAEKGDVKTLIERMSKLIGDNIKAKEKSSKLNESFNKFSMAIEKAINNIGGPGKKGAAKAADDAEDPKELRKLMRVAYKINAKSPVVMNECLQFNIRLAKAVLGYSAVCMKNYK